MDHFEFIRESILTTVPGTSERALIEQIEISEEEDGNIVIMCPNIFSQKYLSRQYKDTIIGCIRSTLRKEVDVHFCVRTKNQLKNTRSREGQPIQMTLPAMSSQSLSNQQLSIPKTRLTATRERRRFQFASPIAPAVKRLCRITQNIPPAKPARQIPQIRHNPHKPPCLPE